MHASGATGELSEVSGEGDCVSCVCGSCRGAGRVGDGVCVQLAWMPRSWNVTGRS